MEPNNEQRQDEGRGGQELRRLVYTEQEVAEQLGVSHDVLYRLRRAGVITEYRELGRLIRYTPEDVRAALEAVKSAKQPGRWRRRTS